MNKEVQSIIRNLENTLSGEPWFGRALYPILEEVHVSRVYINPGKSGHSLIELLYHMITWADFTLKRLEKDEDMDMAAFEKMDWRVINLPTSPAPASASKAGKAGPKSHTWKKGLAEFKAIHKKIIALLKKKDDSFLKEIVDYRKYNYRFLLNGLIQHNIYHLGQVAYLNKLLK